MSSSDGSTFVRNAPKEWREGYEAEISRIQGMSINDLSEGLTNLTTQCKVERAQLHQQGQPESGDLSSLEGKRCAYHDAYYSRLFCKVFTPEKLLEEYRRLSSKKKGIRLTIVLWAMNRRGIRIDPVPRVAKVSSDASRRTP